MRDSLAALITRVPQVRRLAWRAGRGLYRVSRGDQTSDDISTNGEAYVQTCVLRAVPETTCLQFVDIGGNQGDWTCEILRALPPSRAQEDRVIIDVFEPTPGPLSRLRSAVSATGRESLCRIHQMAMSDTEGEVTIGIMSEHGGTNSIHFESDTSAQPIGTITVAATSLNMFCHNEGIEHLHLIKSDTEGYDFAVIRGAGELFKKRRIDVMQFEYGHRWVFNRSYLRDVFALIAGLPYQLAKVQPGFLEVYEEWHPELERYFQANYAVVSERALGWFEVRKGRFDAANTYA
jgi:FkbM family methyltransferase